MKKNPKLEFQVNWESTRGYHVFGHCPICRSSFASGDWKRNAQDAMDLAHQNLYEHIEKVHNVRHSKTKRSSKV